MGMQGEIIIRLRPILTVKNMELTASHQSETLTLDPLPSICHARASAARTEFRIALNASACFMLALAVFLGIHLLNRSVIATLILLLPVPFAIHHDYKAYLSLGPGGTPSTFTGYLKIAYLRLFAIPDPFAPPIIRGDLLPAQGYFSTARIDLPDREGVRPDVIGIAPQRQVNQPGDLTCYLNLRSALESLAASSPARIRTGTSCFEKQGLALFARKPLNATCRGEICHVHHSDRSLHMNVHPADAKVVLERGWGQRHPLAKGGWAGGYVPREFIMVYAPRTKEELVCILRIIEAAAWWVAGERHELLGQ
jgi:hypothetical protein